MKAQFPDWRESIISVKVSTTITKRRMIYMLELLNSDMTNQAESWISLTTQLKRIPLLWAVFVFVVIDITFDAAWMVSEGVFNVGIARAKRCRKIDYFDHGLKTSQR
jgi:hypothetical protein